MNLDEALKNISWKKAEYFKWKHGILYDQRRKKKTEEEFLKKVELKTLNSFTQWERSAEYKQLLVLLLQARTTTDIKQIYDTVTKKAKNGDEKAVKLFLQLQKEINENAKLAQQSLQTTSVKHEEDDDLILD